MVYHRGNVARRSASQTTSSVHYRHVLAFVFAVLRRRNAGLVVAPGPRGAAPARAPRALMDWGLVLVLLLGAFGGFSAGPLGIGGGTIPVPFITMIFTRGFAPGDRPHGHRHLARHDLVHLDVPVRATTCGAVRWRIVALPSPGILLGSWIGPWMASRCRRPCWRCSSACSSPSRRQMLLGKSQRRARAAALSACSRGGLIGRWPGWWGGRRLHLHPLHGLVQCEDPQRRRHQRRARLPIAGRHPSNIFYGWESIAAVLAVSSTRRRWR